MASYTTIDRDTPSPDPKVRLNVTESNLYSEPPLRYRRRALLLIALYFPLLLIPWIITLVIADRPFSHDSYIKHSGFSRKEIVRVQKWVTAINVLNSIASIATIPIISALLAQAAVVYSQRRSPRQHLSVRHLFALADRGWSDIQILVNAWRWNERGSRSVRTFLYLALGIILISVIQQPLYQILVTFEPKAVTTCADTSYIGLDGYGLSYRECDDRTRNPVSLGIDVEPAQMAVMQQRFTIARMNPELASISEDGLQPHLWWDYADNGTIPNTLSQQPALRFMGWKNNQSKPTTDEDPYFHAQNHPLLPQRMFVTALHTNTTTGVLRQHAMRFNSTVECKHINQSQFPKECPGEKPFQAEFKRQAIRDTGLAVCAPGEFDKFPWTLSRNRQDIVEELYIDLNISSRHESGYSDTVYCKASTTRGYFELGNVYNNQRYGPLMEKWPSRDEMWNEYNDYLLWGWGTEIPMEENPMDEKHLNVVALGYRVAGPLMTTAIALFGGESWYKFADSLSNQLRPEEYAPRPEENRTILWEPLCKLTPFNRINDYSIDQYCDSWGFYVEDFMHVFNDALNSTYKLEKSLSASMFLANQALLTMDTHEWREDNKYQDVVGRTIYYSSGMAIQIPVLSTTAKIVTSVLIAAQIIGLIALAIFIYHVPTWTTVLNAMAMARVGASLEPNTLPPIRPLERSDTEKLKSASGLFGVVEATKDIEMQSPKVDQLSPDATSSVENFLEMNVSQGQADLPVKVKRSNTQMQLELGASGIVTRNTTSSEKVKKRVYNS